MSSESSDYNPFVPSEEVGRLYVQLVRSENVGLPTEKPSEGSITKEEYLMGCFFARPHDSMGLVSEERLEELGKGFERETGHDIENILESEDLTPVSEYIKYVRANEPEFEAYFGRFEDDYEGQSVRESDDSVLEDKTVEALSTTVNRFLVTLRGKTYYQSGDVKETVILDKDKLFTPEVRKGLDERLIPKKLRGTCEEFYQRLGEEFYDWAVENPNLREGANFHLISDQESQIVLRAIETESDREVARRKERNKGRKRAEYLGAVIPPKIIESD